MDAKIKVDGTRHGTILHEFQSIEVGSRLFQDGLQSTAVESPEISYTVLVVWMLYHTLIGSTLQSKRRV